MNKPKPTITKIVVHYSDGTTDEISNNWTWDQPPSPFPSWKISNCSKCGLELSGAMGYVCSRIDCPTGMGPRTC